MSFNHTLKYRTFDELLAEVSNDFRKYQLNDLIDPQQMIKIAKKVNYDLGLRITQTKERVLEVSKGRVKLPNDFYTLNFSMLCGDYKVKQYLPQGTHVEEKIIGKVLPEYQQAPPETIDLCEVELEPEPVPCGPCEQCGTDTGCEPCNTCCGNEASCSLTCKGELVQLVQVLKYETRHYSFMTPIRLKSNPKEIDCDCPNLYWNSELTGYIRDGWLYLSFQTGKVYINYQGHLESDCGELLVPDHDMINEYYEYALKKRIIENLIMNDEEVNPQKIQFIEQELRAARNYALSIVNTPNFEELKEVYQANRNAMFSKYYDMFSSYSGRKRIYPRG